MTTADEPRADGSPPEDPEQRVERALQRHVGQTLALGFLVVGVSACVVLGGNLCLWLLGMELRVEAIPAPALLLPFSVAGWLHARSGRLSRAAQRAWYLLGATVPALALLVNLRHDPLEAAQAVGITIWLYPFCIAVTVLTLDRALSHFTAAWCAAQYAVIHAAAASQAVGGPTGPEPIASADGLVRVVALLLVGLAAGHANHRARDTLRKLLAEEQRARDAATAAIRAEERGRAAAAFLGRMSHELKTPLHIILGNAELLLARGELRDEQRAQVEATYHGGRHLLGLVEALLDQARLSSNRTLALTPRPVELDSLLAQLELMLRERAAARGLLLGVAREAAAPDRIHADPLRLRQVLLGLLDNALKYTERGEVGLRVSAGEGPGELRFEVHDTGRGIAAEDLDRVFEPFYRGAPATGSSEGVGLGLSIARALVAAMSGRLELHSAVGVGSRFVVTLPAAVGEPRRASPAHERPPPVAPPANNMSLKTCLPGHPEAGGAVQLPEPVRSALLHLAERGNMAELRRAADAAAAGDPALGPFCDRLRTAADAFDDAAALRLLRGEGPTVAAGRDA